MANAVIARDEHAEKIYNLYQHKRFRVLAGPPFGEGRKLTKEEEDRFLEEAIKESKTPSDRSPGA
jgi:hypothetical protein